ncbi:hypothetical protein [Dyadobacter sediminis]|uniref:Uncharacterized protein n=1 Tax=Dyadobacter sediminis TaxID=1493691 RepID=A0A5R9KJE0_9BACT|nr:hypothetical protein [Dyadobacter sediminis]TLU96337.1 hypothetical protein FEM55_04135 [Dyadobacter sediminis]GGB81409.1 hypothetical protein GCM10011325_06090 [Dyadobacter sediminis]
MEGSAPEKQNIFKYIVFFLLAVAAAGITYYYISPKEADIADNNNVVLFIQNKIIDIDEKLKTGQVDPDLATSIAWHQSNAALYQESLHHKDKQVKEQGNILKNKIIEIQTKQFPELRKSYVQSKESILKQENIQIANAGNRNEILVFTSEKFEPKASQKSFLKNINEIVHDLKFTKVIFKWSPDGKDSREYKISSKNDSEI